MTGEEFHVNRYNGILAVMKKERERFADLEKKLKKQKEEFVNDLKEIAITINNHELTRMKVEKWDK